MQRYVVITRITHTNRKVHSTFGACGVLGLSSLNPPPPRHLLVITVLRLLRQEQNKTGPIDNKRKSPGLIDTPEI